MSPRQCLYEKGLALHELVVLICGMADANEPPLRDEPPADRVAEQSQIFENFPEDVLQKWVTLPADMPISVPLTRQDIDNLLFALLRNNDAHLAIDHAIVRWSNGEMDEANSSLVEFRKFTAQSQNHTRRFFAAIMAQATREV